MVRLPRGRVWRLAAIAPLGFLALALLVVQARLDPLRATLVLSAAWAVWHVPLFALLASYRDFGPLTMVGFAIGLTAGAFVLTSVYNGTGGSILAVALWHGTYNLSVATSASDGAIAAIVTACVIFWGVSLVQARRAGQPPLAPHPPGRAGP